MSDFGDSFHIAICGGCCFLRTASVLTCAQIRRVPVPPVMLCVRRLIVMVVQSRLMEEFRNGCNVHGLCSRLPLAAREPLLNLLQQPAVPIRILERDERIVGTTLRVGPA